MNEIIDRVDDVFLSDECMKKVLLLRINSFNSDIKGVTIDGDIPSIDSAEDSNKKRAIKIKIVRDMLQTCLIDGIDKNTLINISKKFSDKNNIVNISISDVKYLLNLNDEELLNICEKNSNNTSLEALAGYLYLHCANFSLEHNGRTPIYPVKEQVYDRENYNASYMPYTKRIYLNLPDGINRYSFLQQYISHCIEERIPFDMKGMVPDAALDRTVLYSNDFYLEKHIKILDTIIKTNPDIADTIGTPITYGGRVVNEDGRSYYAISGGLPNKLKKDTQSAFVDGITKKAFLTLCASVIKANPKILQKLDFSYLNVEKIGELDKLTTEEITSWLNNQMPGILKTDDESMKKKKEFADLLDYGTALMEKLIEQNPDNINILISSFRNNIKTLASVSRFGDKEHNDVPLYLDDYFCELLEKKDKSNQETENINEDEKNIYLYRIEDLFSEALQEFDESTLTTQERVSKYILKTNYIYKQFRHYAMREPGFVATNRFQEVKENLNGLLFEEYEADGLYDNAYRVSYYQTVQESLNKYINDKRKYNPDDLGDSGFTK